MILESLKYIRQREEQYEWILSGKDNEPVYFTNTNLIVGKNAAGKSRSLTIIAEMANILSLKKTLRQLNTPTWECISTFKDNDNTYSYHIVVKDRIIEDERISIDGIEKLNRKENRIYSELSHEFEGLSISEDEVIISLRKDETKYPYLAQFYEWGSALKKFTFTNQFDKNHLLKRDELVNTDQIKSENTIQLFYEGKELFQDKFIDAIKADMKHLDYSTNQISLEESDRGIGISVQEDELFESTLQTDMSQGMFRALSFIINLNFSLLSKTSVCLLIDDLGEGLDFSRSKSLIDLLIYKINNSDIQIFITTNDRYVMNTIPLKYWSVLERTRKHSTFYNYHNSKNVFDDFKYTGLNNFDFLATDFYLHGFENEEEVR